MIAYVWLQICFLVKFDGLSLERWVNLRFQEEEFQYREALFLLHHRIYEDILIISCFCLKYRLTIHQQILLHTPNTISLL